MSREPMEWMQDSPDLYFFEGETGQHYVRATIESEGPLLLLVVVSSGSLTIEVEAMDVATGKMLAEAAVDAIDAFEEGVRVRKAKLSEPEVSP